MAAITSSPLPPPSKGARIFDRQPVKQWLARGGRGLLVILSTWCSRRYEGVAARRDTFALCVRTDGAYERRAHAQPTQISEGVRQLLLLSCLRYSPSNMATAGSGMWISTLLPRDRAEVRPALRSPASGHGLGSSEWIFAGRIRGHLEFEQDPSDPNGMVSDFFEYPSDSSRRQIRDSDGETERETDERTSSEGGIYIGKVQLKLVSPTSGLLLYTAKDEVFSRAGCNFYNGDVSEGCVWDAE